jgi:uncharacterized membrane protein
MSAGNLPDNPDPAPEPMKRTTLSVVREEAYSGPLPHPDHLSRYDAILPGAAERILRMSETEQRHRHRLDRTSLLLDFAYAIAGQVLGFAVAIGMLIGAYYAAMAGHEAVAGGFLAAGAASMVTAFIKGRAWLASGSGSESK